MKWSGKIVVQRLSTIHKKWREGFASPNAAVAIPCPAGESVGLKSEKWE
jgi:hypothetical protein